MIDYREDARWTVYIHIVPKEISNYSHDKYYVGITSQNPKRRWQNGIGYKTNEYFYRAIHKYKWSNISHEIIANNLTHDEACDMEKVLIQKLKSNDYTYGYNQTIGGDTHLHRTYKGFGNPQAKPIYQFDIDYKFIQKFPSSIEADKATGARSAEAARDGYLSGNSYWAREENIIIENNKIKIKNESLLTGKRGVFQFDKDFNFVQRYKTLRNAHSINNIAHSVIANASKNYTLSHEYYWLKYDDVIISDNCVVMKQEIMNLIINQKENKQSKKIDGCIKIVNISNNELFSSIKNAADFYDIDSSYLRKVAVASITNKKRSAAKCKWLLYDDYLKLNNLTDGEARKSLFFIA